MCNRNLFAVIYYALVLPLALGEYVLRKPIGDSEYLADLLIEIDLYFTLPSFGTEAISFYLTPNPNFDKNLCDDLQFRFKSQHKIIYAKLESSQKNPISLQSCHSPINSLEIISVRPDYAKYLTKVQLVNFIKENFSSKNNQELATKVVRNKALLRESFHLEENFKKVEEGHIEDFEKYTDLYDVLRSINYFYLVADWKMFWLMTQEIEKIENEKILTVQEAYLLMVASENLLDIYLARLWASAYLNLNIKCNYRCNNCSDDLASCKQCKTGFFLNESYCVQCKKLCESCINQETCLTCVKNAYYQSQSDSCLCWPRFGLSSITGDCQPCEEKNCINCGKNQSTCQECKLDYYLSQGSCLKTLKSSSRNLKNTNKIEDYSKNCTIYGTNNTILNLLKSSKVKGDLLDLVIKDFENYVNTEASNDQLLDNTIAIVNEFLNKLQTQALEDFYTLIYANALGKVIMGLNEISIERSNKVMKIAEKILKINSKTDAAVLIINSLLELYREVAYVTRLKTKHITAIKTENLEKNLNQSLDKDIKLYYYQGNFNKSQLITFKIIIIDKPLLEIHINIYSDKSYKNSEIFLENKTVVVLNISANIKLANIYNSTSKCTGRNTDDQEISCELLKHKKYIYFKFNQSGIYSFNQKKPEKKSFSFALSLIIFWIASNLFFIVFRKIKKFDEIGKINKVSFTNFKDDQNVNAGGSGVIANSDKISGVGSEPILEYHLVLGFFMNSRFFCTIERISIYIPSLIIELSLQLYLNDIFSLSPLTQSIFSVLLTLPLTLAIAYFILIKDEKLKINVFILLILVVVTGIIYFLDSSKDWFTSFVLGVLIDFIANQTILLLFIKKLRS